MNIDYQVLKRYMDGNEIKGDKEKIMKWFLDLPAERDLRDKYYIYWNEIDTGQKLEGYDGFKILGSIYHKIKLDEFRGQRRLGFFSKAIHIVSRIAAVLFIPLLIYIFINSNNYKIMDKEVAYSKIYAPFGTRTSFFLPDGTRGWLNSGASLYFPTEFRGKTREVTLKGEAYFDVKTNIKKPFIVSGSHFKVVAYGTAFNILAYQDYKEVKVTLVNGKVEILLKKNENTISMALIKPDQMCVINTNSSTCKIEDVDSKLVTGWKEGKLVFRNESFDEIVKKINRWYNVDIDIMDDRLKSHTYLATFEDETIDEVLKLLKLSAPIDYKILGRKRNNDGTYEKRRIELYYNH